MEKTNFNIFGEQSNGLELDLEKFGGLREDEYVKDGYIWCKKCNTKRLWRSPDGKRVVRCICHCQKAEFDRQEESKRQYDEMIKFKKLQDASLLGERYYEVTFDKTDLNRDESFVTAYNRCKKYCENRKQVQEHGYGIYLWGNSGSGKTHLMACMVNELTKNFVPCLFTNFFEIAKAIKKTFNRSLYTESQFIDQVANIPFLFIDDFGTEKVTKGDEDTWLQDKIYDVINKRYNTRKPTVFSSNLAINELTEKQGLSNKTVDRVIEMSSAIIEVKGESYRFINRETDLPY